LDEKGALKATWQHASAFAKPEIFFKLAAIVAIVRKNGHASLFTSHSLIAACNSKTTGIP
jgi:hypothetical protein